MFNSRLCSKYTAVSKLRSKFQEVYAKFTVEEIYTNHKDFVPPITYELIKHIIEPWPVELTTVLKVKNPQTNRYNNFILVMFVI